MERNVPGRTGAADNLSKKEHSGQCPPAQRCLAGFDARCGGVSNELKHAPQWDQINEPGSPTSGQIFAALAKARNQVNRKQQVDPDLEGLHGPSSAYKLRRSGEDEQRQ